MSSGVATDAAIAAGTRQAASGRLDVQRLALELFQTFRDMSFDGVGISRETYGPGETSAMQVIERLGRGPRHRDAWDAARNLILRLPGRTPTAGGCHRLASRQRAAGRQLRRRRRRHRQPDRPARRPTARAAAADMELYVLRGEESAWYGGPCYFGSRALFGQLTDSDFKSMHRSSGRSLEHHMAPCGVDLAPLKAAPAAARSRAGSPAGWSCTSSRARC